ncbi:Utp9p TDEL_0D00530 [Torulaspora delbrueckii]|uniref:Small-subunit processome Utp12 domain-containing protein n=1 Tax=Torulaspora delbrueckii TaxID=4950 RepID=G8ZSP3_TORDE|nr:hypothetical protein TDEL_0D00530 [Torulaspora delbrueckii]CCE91637.1 hypothetical protein TDEL_0D00530 [Torulaspora delbrueckii]
MKFHHNNIQYCRSTSILRVNLVSSEPISMISKQDLIASFSPDARQFAFQTNVSQKNVIDIYPLEASNGYNVNSSLVSHIDYESNDLRVTEIFHLGWCSSLVEDSKQRVKRKNGDENNVELDTDTDRENFFVNAVSPGKIVIFSSSGKDIVNIVQNKSSILHVSLEDAYIWLLDNENAIKKLQYNQAKQIKSFHIVDGKDEEITYFKALRNDRATYLCYASKDRVYVIDPSKRRPTTVATLAVGTCISSEILENGDLAIGTETGLSVFNLESKSLVQEWQTEAKILRVIKDTVLCLNSEGEILAFRLGTDIPICKIKVVDSQIIEFVRVADSVMVAWLNVNEPSFKLISLGDLNGNDEIIINDQKDDKLDGNELATEGKQEPHSSEDDDEQQQEDVIVSRKKVTKAEQDELSKSLVQALESLEDAKILEIVCSDKWNEHRVKSFIITQLIADDALSKFYEVTALAFQHNPWENNEISSLWMKWLLTLKGDLFFNSSSQSKHAKKQARRLRASLKASGDCLPVLLGIQGRLEMLKRQSQLREELAQVNLTETEGEEEVETVLNEEEQEPSEANDEYNNSISYANGESDTFVDASEFRSPA